MKHQKANLLKSPAHIKCRDIKTRISEEATKLFCEKGFGATSVSEIVDRAGVTKPVLYYYFENKAALFESLYCDHFDQFHQMLKQAVRMEGSARQKLLHLTIEQFHYCRRHLARVRFIANTVMGPRKGIPCVRFPQLHRTYAQLFSQMLKQGIEKGEIRCLPLERLGMIYMGMIHTFLIKQLYTKRWILTSNLAKHIVDIFFFGIGADSTQLATLSKEHKHA